MNIPFISTKIYEGHYPINFYFQPEAWNGRPALIGTPGLLEWCDTGYNAEVRGAKPLNKSLAYSVVGEKVFRQNVNGDSVECTGTLETDTGIVQMETDGTHVMIVDPGKAGYYTSGTTLSKIVDPDFPIPSSLTFQDGYFIVTAKDSGRFHISPLNSPGGDWDELDYSTAEGSPDFAVKGFMSHRELFVFGEESIEPYQNTGNADFPFERMGGRFVEHGLGASETVAKFADSLIWLADDFSIRTFVDGTPQVIAPETLSQTIGSYTKKSDAFGFSYKYKGNWFYIITFPTEGKTWMINARTRGVNQLSSGISGNRHRSNCHMFFAGKNLVGDYQNGKIYELSDSTFTDDGDTIKRVRVSPALFDPDGYKMLTYPYLQIEFKAGMGLVSGQGSDPAAMLRYSDDGCRTWSNEEWLKVGKMGENTREAVWEILGSSKQRNFEISVTDPIEWVILNAYSPVVKGK